MKFILKNAVLLDALHENVKGDVLIEDGIIRKTAESIEKEGGAEIIDIKGLTLLPGFIDPHVHVAIDDAGFSDKAIKAWAYNGVTTVRELGMLSTLSGESFIKWIKEHDTADYARVIKSGKYIDVDGGYGMGPIPGIEMGIKVNSPEEAADAVTRKYKEGCDGIKIGISEGFHGNRPALTPGMIRAICERAHSHGIWVSAHLGKSETLRMLVDCGISDAAHTPEDTMPDSLISEMVKKKIPMITTIGDPDAPPPDPKDMPPGMPPMDIDEMMRSMAERRKKILENLRRFHKAGGIIAAGTDLIHSKDFMKEARIPVHELVQLRKIGMSFIDVIKAGTVNGAMVCGIKSEEGTIEPGKHANLIAVSGLDDSFRALGDPRFVMNRGKILRNSLR